MPVTNPVAVLKVKMPAEPGLLHTPPIAGLLKVELAPTHNVVAPVMGDRLFTVTVVVLMQPFALV
jgi:hypothetical protein